MKNKFIPWTSTTYLRFLLLFIVILMPIYIIGLLIYNWGVDAVEEQVYQSVDSQMTYYLDALTTDVEQMKVLMLDALNDDNLNDLAMLSPVKTVYEKQKAITRLQQRLNAIKSSSELIADVVAYIPQNAMKVSGGNGFSAMSENEVTDLVDSKLRFTSTPQLQADHLLLRASFPNSAGRKPIFVIDLSISLENLTQSLSNLARNEDGEQVVLRNLADRSVIAAVHATQGALNWHPHERSGRTFIEDGKDRLFAVYNSSEELDMGLTRYVDSDLFFGPVHNYQRWFWFFSLTATLIIVFFSVFLYRFIHQPLVTLIRAFRKLQEGDFNLRIHRRKKDDFTYLYDYFNVTVEHLHSLIDQVYKQKILVQHAELKQLQAQINPHFLYNSFFMLHRMIKLEDNENAVVVSKKLGQFFQYITRNTADELLLAREVEHAQNYAEIQQMRLGNRLRLTIGDVPDAFQYIYVPRLILQPLLENAIEHGLYAKEQNGSVNMRFIEEESAWLIEVEDNGAGMEEFELREMSRRLTSMSESQPDFEVTGLMNIHHRLHIKFGFGSGISLCIGSGGGLLVQLRLSKEGIAHVSHTDRG